MVRDVSHTVLSHGVLDDEKLLLAVHIDVLGEVRREEERILSDSDQIIRELTKSMFELPGHTVWVLVVPLVLLLVQKDTGIRKNLKHHVHLCVKVQVLHYLHGFFRFPLLGSLLFVFRLRFLVLVLLLIRPPLIGHLAAEGSRPEVARVDKGEVL